MSCRLAAASANWQSTSSSGEPPLPLPGNRPASTSRTDAAAFSSAGGCGAPDTGNGCASAAPADVAAATGSAEVGSAGATGDSVSPSVIVDDPVVAGSASTGFAPAAFAFS